MPYTKPNHHIQIGMCLVQQPCLQDRIAHGCPYLLTFLRNAHRTLGLTGHLTGDSIRFETVRLKNAGKHTGFPNQSDAIGNSYPLGLNLPGELHDFLYPCPLTVSFKLHFRTGYHDFTVPAFVITFQSPCPILFFQVSSRTKLRISTRLELAILRSAVHTTM